MAEVIRIERTNSLHGDERPVRTKRGYQLVDRRIPHHGRNVDDNATFVDTLDEAAALIEGGYAIRMGEPEARRGNYIYPESLRIIRA